MSGLANKRMETDELRPEKMEAPFAAHPQPSAEAMNIHPIMRWALVTGCLSLVVVPQLGCKSSKVVGGSTIRASTGTSAHVPADKIIDLDPIRWKLDRCERHGLLMTEAIVPLKRGNDRPEDFDRDYLVASVELFPHAEGPFLRGGPPHRETHARVRHCANCIAAKTEWLKTHPNVDECGQPRRTRTLRRTAGKL